MLDRGRILSAIATAAVPGRDAADIMLALRRRGINTGASLREDGVIDMDAKGASSVLRVSPHYYNTRDEIDAAVSRLGEILASRPRDGES